MVLGVKAGAKKAFSNFFMGEICNKDPVLDERSGNIYLILKAALRPHLLPSGVRVFWCEDG